MQKPVQKPLIAVAAGGHTVYFLNQWVCHIQPRLKSILLIPQPQQASTCFGEGGSQRQPAAASGSGRSGGSVSFPFFWIGWDNIWGMLELLNHLWILWLKCSEYRLSCSEYNIFSYMFSHFCCCFVCFFSFFFRGGEFLRPSTNVSSRWRNRKRPSMCWTRMAMARSPSKRSRLATRRVGGFGSLPIRKTGVFFFLGRGKSLTHPPPVPRKHAGVVRNIGKFV